MYGITERDFPHPEDCIISIERLRGLSVPPSEPPEMYKSNVSSSASGVQTKIQLDKGSIGCWWKKNEVIGSYRGHDLDAIPFTDDTRGQDERNGIVYEFWEWIVRYPIFNTFFFSSLDLFKGMRT